MIRGRERSKPELAHQLMSRIQADAQEFGRQDGDMRKQDWAVSALLVSRQIRRKRCQS